MLGVLAAVLIVAGVVTIVVLVNRGEEDGPAVAGPGTCTENGQRAQVIAYFDGPNADAEMQAAADSLRGRDLVAAVGTETRQRAFERFKEIFKDQPELVKLTRPEALPASVWVLPSRRVQPGDLAASLRTDLPEADDIRSDACVQPPTEQPRAT